MTTLLFHRSPPRYPALAGILLLGCLLWPAGVEAELTWAKKVVELRADARTTVLEAKFHFTNTGSRPIDIRQIESSCGCTTAELEQRHYPPGTGGDIIARYTIGNHVGQQTKTIAVATSDREQPTILTLSVQIPEVMRIAPAYVTWKHAEDSNPKTITLEQMQETPIDDITVQSSNTGFAVTMQTLVKGRKYRLDITPAQTAQTTFATLTIRCKYGEEEKTYKAYATVKPGQTSEQ